MAESDVCIAESIQPVRLGDTVRLTRGMWGARTGRVTELDGAQAVVTSPSEDGTGDWVSVDVADLQAVERS